MRMFAHKPIKRLLLLSVFMLIGNTYAQNLAELRHFTTAQYKMDFYISSAQKKINYTDTLYYHWFKSQKLHITQGGSAGNLLHGNFQKFHVNGQLAERGEFKYGLKDGEWLTWYESGELESKQIYKKGVLNGSFSTYSKDGEITEEGKFKKGRKKQKRQKKDQLIEEKEEEKGEEEVPWYKKIFKIEKKENPEKEAKRLARRTRRQERKMAKEREVNND